MTKARIAELRASAASLEHWQVIHKLAIYELIFEVERLQAELDARTKALTDLVKPAADPTPPIQPALGSPRLI